MNDKEHTKSKLWYQTNGETARNDESGATLVKSRKWKTTYAKKTFFRLPKANSREWDRESDSQINTQQEEERKRTLTQKNSEIV